MADYDPKSMMAVLEQKLKDIERRLTNSENTARVLMLLVLTTVIGTAMKTIGLN